LQDALFEIFSAMSTVGLSTGITRALSPFNRVVVIAMMFCGRIGSLSMMMALAERLPPRVKDPVEHITIG
ncbi:MAG: Trk family potassium uptake protein, partial [Oscillospiraceae bacterium]|nr:Trk family potassium uptake protein [Oscillospiraceae bacterium]